ncbi:MAG: insulinase family protein [Bernardetiaceae bacterium]|nr:insulinase family protein [Bernardetiaceae bacterium]
MNRALFKTHPYGTQTVIGTIEHLKNPSITEINRYFAKYYVPNNVAVCLSGDLEFAPTMKLIDQYFGKWERRDLPAYQPVAEAPLAVPQQVEVIGPDAEQVQVGFRLPGRASPDYLTAQVVDMMLANSVAGLIDLNLKQAQKVLDAGCYLNAMNDFTVHQFNGTPREGQTLDQVRDLLLAQIDSLKKGKFEDWLIPAVITDLKKQKLYSYEENYSRADEFVTAFSNEMKWQDYVSALARMKSIGRPQVIDFVNKHYQNNYAVVFKRTGKDPNAQKVEKPKITKVEINREAKSERAKALEALTPPRLKPQFLDYSKDLTLGKMDGGVEILYKQNQENDLFQLNYLLDMGSNHNPKFKLAVQYLEYLGSDKLSAVDLKKELYKLGCNFSVFAAEERVYVSLYGLDENLEPALQIFEDLLANPQPDSVALANMVAGILKKRDDDKKEKFAILYQGLMSYARYGAKSPFTNVLKNSELQTLKPAELTQLVQQLTQYQHQVLYYGKRPLASLTQTLNKLHRLPAQLKPVPAPVNFTELDNKEGRVFWTDYDMVQAEIVFGRSGQLFNRELQPAIRLYNEYMSGNMSSIAFQEIREAQGLAYSVWTSYGSPSNLRQRDYLMAYVGTQADKQAEAMQALLKIMDDMPLSENAFKTAKDAILSKIESERVIRGGVLFNYLNAKQLGLDQDLRQEVYQAIQGLTLADLQKFQQAQVKGAKYTVAVLADQDKINLPDLAKYGKVQRLTLEEIFGY